jgi:hypothetical protein
MPSIEPINPQAMPVILATDAMKIVARSADKEDQAA